MYEISNKLEETWYLSMITFVVNAIYVVPLYVSLPQKMAKVAKYSWETQPKWFTCACLYEASRTILRESALKVL